MLSLHFYSKSELCYKELKLPVLAAVAVGFIAVTSSLTMMAAYLGADPLGIASIRTSSIAKENEVLRAHLASMNKNLATFRNEMNSLMKSDDQLRTSVNLPPIPGDIKDVAIGGSETNPDYGLSTSANKLITVAMTDLNMLERKARLEEQSYVEILKKYKKNQDLFAHIPAINPIRGGIETDGFGMRLHPILHVRLMHEGMDIVAIVGTGVHSTGDGVVSYVGRRGGYGNVVEIEHGFGYSTLYGHLSEPLVAAGQRVQRGQVIALSGNTGLSTAPHLHYEVRKNGIHVDPAEYFFDGISSLPLYQDHSTN